MAYLSLYRKWRPQSFADVVGQEHVVRTLRNALDTGRCAHAYIFAGPRGTGKTTLARLLAKGLNCEKGPTSAWCNVCDSCQRIARGHSVDVIEIDGASNRGIDEIRDVREKVKYAPAEGRYKVYIIDEVHMLTTEAFNALLKVLEEPPGHVVFIFATTEAYRIPATIVSRCQKFDFHAFSPAQIAEQVRRIANEEGVELDEGALNLIARHSAGGMRDALGYLDQCIAYADREITESLAAQVLGVVEAEHLEALAAAVASGDLAAALTLVKRVMDSGRDLRQFARDAVQFFRDLMLIRAAPGNEGLVVLWGSELERARALAQRFEVSQLLRIVERLGRSEADMRWAQTVQLPLEMALIELLREEPADGLAELARRVEALEARLAGLGSGVSAAQGAAPGPSVASRGAGGAERPSRELTATSGAERAVAAGTGSGLPTRQDAAASARPEPAAPVRPEPAAPSRQEAASRTGEPAPAAAAGDQAFLARVRREWPRLLEFMRSSRFIQQEAFLREGVPGSFQNGILTVYFSQSHRFHQANIAQEKNRVIVEKAVGKVFGVDVRIEAVIGEPPPAPSASDAPQAAPQPAPQAGSESAPQGHPQDAPVDAAPSRESPPGEPGPGQKGTTRGAAAGAPSRKSGDGWTGSTPSGTIDPDEIDEPVLKAALKLFGGTITLLERKEAD